MIPQLYHCGKPLDAGLHGCFWYPSLPTPHLACLLLKEQLTFIESLLSARHWATTMGPYAGGATLIPIFAEGQPQALRVRKSLAQGHTKAMLQAEACY